MNLRQSAAVIGLFVASTSILMAEKPFLPPAELKILMAVARDYHLSADQSALLLVIRRVESGGPGVEMGVGQSDKRHPARRYKGRSGASLYLQASWAAGTILGHYSGLIDLPSFSRRYCPYNHNVWLKNVLKLLDEARVYVQWYDKV